MIAIIASNEISVNIYSGERELSQNSGVTRHRHSLLLTNREYSYCVTNYKHLRESLVASVTNYAII